MLVVLIGKGLIFGQSAQSFKNQQLKNKRVKQAYTEKWSVLASDLTSKGIASLDFDVLIRSFKYEQEFELWVKEKTASKYCLLKTLRICASSGELGPKRREGDGQVPEGIYDVPVFNPNSNYYLALKVGYPNKSDRILKKGPAGGDIMIHGNCVTIGCIPLQDDPIKEVYILCVEAKNKNNQIRVELFPCRFTQSNEKVLTAYSEEKNNFWKNLKTAYVYFEEKKLPAPYVIDDKGNYCFNK